jgi:biotin-dependent carboxylase-like uncharacterized protein
MTLEVLKPGLLTTVQDGGRPGLACFGIGGSGAMDGPCHALANALVGNRSDAAALEISLLGPTLRMQHDCVLALTGAPISARVEHAANRFDMPRWRPVFLRAGSLLSLGGMASGARSYLAVAGGLQAASWMGSASVDLHAGIGRALAAGDELLCKRSPQPNGLNEDQRWWPSWSINPKPWFDPAPRPLRLVAGSHFDALDESSRRALFENEFRLSADSNRVGFRLLGRPLKLTAGLELISEPVSFGTVQLPPAGDPIVLMREHPTTGGYPRIARVAAVDLPVLAQRQPGDALGFERIAADAAEQLLIRQLRTLQELAAAVRARVTTA